MTCTCCPFTIAAVTFILAYAIYRFFSTKNHDSPEILKKDFEKDKVYLYQFPRMKQCPNMSPFCLKLEIIFRLHNIPYEIVNITTKKSRSGFVPFVELNGEHIVDSDLIEMRIRKHFKVPELDEEQEAQSVAVSRMADNHFFYVCLHYKCSTPLFFSTVLSMVPIPDFLKPIALFFFTFQLKNKLKTRAIYAIGDFNENELAEILHRDLKTFESSLKNKKFLFGDKVTCADATVFGQLSSVYHPFDSHLRRVIDTEFPRLVKYMEDVIQQVYPHDFTFVLLRYKGAVPEFFATILSMLPVPVFLQPIAIRLLGGVMGKKIKKSYGLVLGSFTDEEHEQIMHRDLKTIETLLTDKKFLFGDKVTCADATVFGQLSSVYHPFDSFVRQVIDKDYPRLKKYLDDVIEQVYPNDFTS